MGRTRSIHYPENQALILDTAARLFADKGFARTSIAQLARACHCSKALLYHYYTSKEAILYALLRAHLERLHTMTDQALATSNDPETQLRALVQASMAVYTESQDKHVVLLNDLSCLPAAQRDEVRQLERELTGLVADLLTRLNPVLNQAPHLRMPYTMMFYGLLNWTYLWYDAQGPMTPDMFAQHATELFLHGFKSLHLSIEEPDQRLDHLLPCIDPAQTTCGRSEVLSQRGGLNGLVARTSP